MLWTVCVFFIILCLMLLGFTSFCISWRLLFHVLYTCSCSRKNLRRAFHANQLRLSPVKRRIQLYVETIYGLFYLLLVLLRFAWGITEAKCILATAVGVSVCLFVPRRIPTLLLGPAYVTWETGSGCPLVVQYWADLQSVHGFCCYDNIHVCKQMHIAPNA